MKLRDDLPDWLTERLAKPLPGPAAQRPYAPRLCYGRHFGPPRYDARPAAVMLLLCGAAPRWTLPLTLRPKHLSEHGGQISLPGGAVDEGETLEECALRELEEELAVSSEAVQVLGRLSPVYVFASNFLVQPVVGVARGKVAIVPNPQEVAEVLMMPLETLPVDARLDEHAIQRGGLVFRAPHIEHDEHRIWGATCIILGELAALLREAGGD